MHNTQSYKAPRWRRIADNPHEHPRNQTKITFPTTEDAVKSVSKTAKRPIQRRKRVSLSSKVTPIAVKSSANSSEATIPVAIQTSGDSPQAKALIPVEVKTTKGKSVRRAAAVPITVRSTSRPHKVRTRSRRRSVHKRNVKAKRASEVRTQGARVHQQDFVTKTVMALTTAEETAVNLAGQWSITVLDLVPRWVNIALGKPFELAEQASDRAESFLSEATAAVEDLAA